MTRPQHRADASGMTLDHPASWRRLAARPLLLLVLALVVLNAAAWVVDDSSLRQAEDSWGFVIAMFLLSMYAVPVVVVAAIAAGMSFVVQEPREQAVCAWIGAVVSGLAGLVVALTAVPQLWTSPAGAVFAVVALAVAASLLWPVVTCVRRERAGA